MQKIKKYRKILSLRKKGYTFTQIGKELGFTRQRAWQLYLRISDGSYIPQLARPLCGFIYITGSTKHGWYKIGMTGRQPKFRLRNIQQNIPFKLDFNFWATSKNCFEDERLIQKTYSEFKLRGEWFRLSKEQVSEVKKHIENCQ